MGFCAIVDVVWSCSLLVYEIICLLCLTTLHLIFFMTIIPRISALNKGIGHWRSNKYFFFIHKVENIKSVEL